MDKGLSMSGGMDPMVWGAESQECPGTVGYVPGHLLKVRSDACPYVLLLRLLLRVNATLPGELRAVATERVGGQRPRRDAEEVHAREVGRASREGSRRRAAGEGAGAAQPGRSAGEGARQR